MSHLNNDRLRHNTVESLMLIFTQFQTSLLGYRDELTIQSESSPDKYESDPVLICNIYENHESDPDLICQCKIMYFYFAS